MTGQKRKEIEAKKRNIPCGRRRDGLFAPFALFFAGKLEEEEEEERRLENKSGNSIPERLLKRGRHFVSLPFSGRRQGRGRAPLPFPDWSGLKQ